MGNTPHKEVRRHALVLATGRVDPTRLWSSPFPPTRTVRTAPKPSVHGRRGGNNLKQQRVYKKCTIVLLAFPTTHSPTQQKFNKKIIFISKKRLSFCECVVRWWEHGQTAIIALVFDHRLGFLFFFKQ